MIPHGHHVLAASTCVASQPETLCPLLEYLVTSRTRFQHCQTRRWWPKRDIRDGGRAGVGAIVR